MILIEPYQKGPAGGKLMVAPTLSIGHVEVLNSTDQHIWLHPHTPLDITQDFSLTEIVEMSVEVNRIVVCARTETISDCARM